MEEDFKYYIEHQNELLPTYNGKYLVIRNKKVVDAYNDVEHAVHCSRQKYTPGTYIIQLCTPGNSAYTIHSCSRIRS